MGSSSGSSARSSRAFTSQASGRRSSGPSCTASFPGHCPRCCSATAIAPAYDRKRRPHLQLRILSTGHARGRGQAAGHARAARTARAEVLFGHLRRGRLDARPDVGSGAGDTGGGTARGAAYLVHWFDSREHTRDAGDVSRTRHRASRRAARRLAVGHGRRRRISLRERVGGGHPRGGAETPRWIRRKLESFGDDTVSIRAFGLDVVTDLCDDLLAHGAPGLHFYTLNQASLTTIIWQRLALS